MRNYRWRWGILIFFISLAGGLGWLYGRIAGGVRTDFLGPAIVAAFTLGVAPFLYFQERHDNDQQVLKALLIELEQTREELANPIEEGVKLVTPAGEVIEARLHLLPVYGMSEAARRAVLDDELTADLLHILGDIEVYNRRVELFLQQVVGETEIPDDRADLWRANLEDFYRTPLEQLHQSLIDDMGELIEEIGTP